jgi:hypothetical protein
MDDSHRQAINRHLDAIRSGLTDPTNRTADAWIALSELQQVYDAAIHEEQDRAFGHGWRQGRAVGQDEGWAERDDTARSELLVELAKTHAAVTELQTAREELADPIAHFEKHMERTTESSTKADRKVN